jgi:hypothetical protein
MGWVLVDRAQHRGDVRVAQPAQPTRFGAGERVVTESLDDQSVGESGHDDVAAG